MDVYDAIRQRRSVRKFEDRPIADDVLTRVLDAGILAPTGRNTQEGKYVVVRDPETKNRLADADLINGILNRGFKRRIRRNLK